MTVVPVLKDSQRFKLDATDDAIFYSEPRFVHHLDAGFRARLTSLSVSYTHLTLPTKA